MKNGETYALDMTGAQYGWSEAVTSWPLYNASRIRKCEEILTFGGTRIFHKARAVKNGGQLQYNRGIKEQFAESVDGAVDRWQKDHISLTELLRVPEGDFQKSQASLVDAVADWLQRYKNSQEAQGVFYFTGGFKEGEVDRTFTRATRSILSPEGLASLNNGPTEGS